MFSVLLWPLSLLFFLRSRAEASSLSCKDLESRYASLEQAHENLYETHADLTRELEKVIRERDALVELISDPNGVASSPFENVIGNEEVAVRTSTLPRAGRGSFALRNFEVGEILGIYHCRHVASVHADAHRSWHINDTHSCDGHMLPLNNPIVYVNSIAAEDSCGRQNAAKSTLPSGEVVYIATKAVLVGEEILVDYGHQFFLPEATAGSSAAGYNHDADFHLTYQCNMSPLRVAGSRKDWTDVERLLKEDVAAASEIGEDGWTPLMDASARGLTKAVQILLDQGGNVRCNHADSGGQTALFLAAERGHTAVVELLALDPCVDSTLARRDGAVPLYIAAHNGHFEVAQVLVRAGVDINEFVHNGETLLLSASVVGDAAAARVLLQVGADPGKRREMDGMPPLFVASQKGYASVVRHLLGVIKNVNEQSISGISPLIVATANGHSNVVSLLVTNRTEVDVNAPLSDGATAVYLAAEFGHIEVRR